MDCRSSVVCFLVLVAPGGLLSASPCSANTVPNLGAAGNFALLGLNNSRFVIGGSSIAGNIGIGQGGTAANNSGFVGGSGIQYSSGQITNTASISGGLIVDSSQMASANANAISAYNAAVANTLTQNIGNISGATTITGNGGLNVVNIGNVSLSGTSITLSGTSSDIFVLRVSGDFVMSGKASILLGPNVTAENVLIVFTGTGKTINIGINGSGTVNGTLLAPSASTNWQIASGSFNGEIITGTPASGGGTFINLNNVFLKGVPFRGVPEPSSLVLAGIASAGLLSLSRLKRKRTPKTEVERRESP